MQATATLNRRQFLGASSGLTVAFVLPALGQSPRAEAATAARVNTWLTVGSDNSITLTVGASDMGQGSFQGLAQLLAEDLMVDYRRVVLVQGGPTMANPAPVGAAIKTVGSGVTRNDLSRRTFPPEILPSGSVASGAVPQRFGQAIGVQPSPPDHRFWVSAMSRQSLGGRANSAGTVATYAGAASRGDTLRAMSSRVAKVFRS